MGEASRQYVHSLQIIVVGMSVSRHCSRHNASSQSLRAGRIQVSLSGRGVGDLMHSVYPYSSLVCDMKKKMDSEKTHLKSCPAVVEIVSLRSSNLMNPDTESELPLYPR